MTHRNAPPHRRGTPSTDRALPDETDCACRSRDGVSRACASKWVNRYRSHGELGTEDRSSTPHDQPTTTPSEVLALIEELRPTHKWNAARIAFELAQAGTPISRRTVSRHLAEIGINRRRFIDPNGESNRQQRKIHARRPGHMIHVDVKKVGRIPDGGGWRAHGRGSAQAKAVNRRMKTERRGYVYLHSAIDGYSRLAYTEALPDEKAVTAIAFLHRARTRLAAHGITRIERTVTDNDACYRAESFTRTLLGARHQRIAPYTPRHNGKVERYNRILAEEFLYARTWTSKAQRTHL